MAISAEGEPWGSNLRIKLHPSHEAMGDKMADKMADRKWRPKGTNGAKA